MEWNDLRIFLAAVRAGSYTAAAGQLGINRTTVGRRIDALEAALGVELFQYGPSGPSPTRAGEQLLAAAAAMERETETLTDLLYRPRGPEPAVRIASSASIASEFVDLFAQFQAGQPDMAVELLTELDPVEAVTARRADLGIAILRIPPKRLVGIEIGAIAQARYRRRGSGSSRAIGWGLEMQHALPGRSAGAAPPTEESEAARASFFNNWPDLKRAVLAGMGSAPLWCFAADADPELERLEPADPADDFPLWLIYRAKMPPGRGLRMLVDFLGPALRERISTDRPAP